ncbi:hypothetical protein HZA56_13915 [Candidatus Poribacteria bacterium]|nr:hypothetical protein [Candidatus Poribacteria bacterium]
MKAVDRNLIIEYGWALYRKQYILTAESLSNQGGMESGGQKKDGNTARQNRNQTTHIGRDESHLCKSPRKIGDTMSHRIPDFLHSCV